MIRGFLLVAISVLVWGVTFVNTKALLRQFSALEIQVLRFTIAYLVLWGLHPRLPKIPRRQEVIFVLMGLSGVAVYQLLENCAIHYTNASNVAILVSLCPIVTALLVKFFGSGGRFNVKFYLGCLVAMVGVVLVSLNGIKTFHFSPLGDFMAVFAMLSWGFYSMLVDKFAASGYSQLLVVRRMFFWALVSMIPFVLFGATKFGGEVLNNSFAINLNLAENGVRFTNALNYLNLTFLGVLASAMCFVLWNKACLILGVPRCTVGLYLIPAVAVIFAMLFLGEKLTWVSAIGALLIISGVAVSSYQKR